MLSSQSSRMPKIRSVENLPGSKYLKVARKNSAANWRIQINQTHLVTQASAILLQRHAKYWSPLLKSLNLSSNFTPSLFHLILNRIQTYPEICLSFFNWAKKALDFKPDLKTHCELTQILLGSGRSKLGNPLLDSIIREYPASKIVPLLVQSRKASEPQSIFSILNSVIECYCSKDMYPEALKSYQLAMRYGVGLSAASCNALLDLLVNKSELRLARCAFASMMRNGLVDNQFSWSVIAKILCEDGKVEKVSAILEMGIHTPLVFDIMIEGYSNRGNFDSAFYYLNEMNLRRIVPSFNTYSSILDGACRYHDSEVIETVLHCMVEKRYLPKSLVTDFDLIVQKLSNMGKTYAMDLFFKRACDEKIELHHATYGCMLKGLLYVNGRVNDAIDLYYILRDKNISIDKSCYEEFLVVLCKEKPSPKVTKLLVEILRGGFFSASIELSEYIRTLCAEGRWREAEEILNLVLEHGISVDSLSYGSFVKHYCSSRQIDSAILLHNKLVEVSATLDLTTYNVLLSTLLKEKRIEQAWKVFDYVRTCKMLSSESFVVMIKGLCREKELRKAMKLHDEMLELGMKPDKKTYKKLISGFS